MSSRKTITMESVRARDLLVGDVVRFGAGQLLVLEVWSPNTPMAKVEAEASAYVKGVLSCIDSRWVLVRTTHTRPEQMPTLTPLEGQPVSYYKGGSNTPVPGVPDRVVQWRLWDANELIATQVSHQVFTAEPHMVDRYLPGDQPPESRPELMPIASQAMYPIDDEDGAVDVQIFRSNGSDGAIVVQIDTPATLGDDPEEFLRVNVNDAPIWGPKYGSTQDRHLT